STSAASVPSPSASAWPKVVVVNEPETSAPETTFDELEDASIIDDAFSDAPFDSDAHDVRHDVYDDAPLMGTKTFIDETPMRGIRKITVAAAKVHKAPKDQNIVATLPRGTEISLVASIYEDWLRIRFTDPNTSIRRQGWIYASTFAGPKTKTCPAGWTWHQQDGGWCDRECNKNTDCKAIKGFKCSGTLCFYAGDDPR
ncbi:MAG: hypothetical protein ACXWUG_04320, partial [Polyangiales bacterium]